MNSIVKKLEHQFLPDNRYAIFGPVLLSLEIKGIKGLNCNLSFDFPITAIAGFNGAGKSTIAQIALCMYRAPTGDNINKRKYLKDFFVKTLLDKSPYLPNSHIRAQYAANKEQAKPIQMSMFDDVETLENIKTIDVYYSTDRWAGYKHQPQKNVYYYGMSYFIPYQEQNSNLLRDGKANVKESVQFDDKIVKIVADILSIRYTNLQSNAISNDKRTESVISANKASATYSENHMGCGEGRLLKLVHALESAPSQSLFVIEEPETALHQLAQHKLSQYFLDVCNRKKHQIIFTTHSPEMQRVLPLKARKYIHRDSDGNTLVITNPSIAEIENYLSGGHIRKMIIVTEDNIGLLYVKEIMRMYCPNVFRNCEFFAMNLGYKEIKEYVKKSQKCGIKIFGVVDENRRADIPNYVLAFPEEDPPEISLFRDSELKEQVKVEFDFNCDELEGDHHNFFESIANSRNEEISYVQNRCLKLYIQNKGEGYYKTIIDTVKQWLSECND